MWQCRCTPCANACLQGTAHVNVGNAGASFSWDVLDPALLSQSLYTTVAVAHGYSKMNVTRTSLPFQVCSALRHRFLAGSLLELLMGCSTGSRSWLSFALLSSFACACP